MNSAVIIGYLWLVFIIVWFVSALSAKKTARYNFGAWGMRVLIAVLIIFFLTYVDKANYGLYFFRPNPNPILDLLGTLLCAIGICFAFYARFYLGKNWGMPMTLKENPELVTSGPYQYVRHPIYSGILLAALGSGLAAGILWFIVLIVYGIYFVYAAKAEEKIMTKEFPQQYPEYKARTKMIIPFIL